MVVKVGSGVQGWKIGDRAGVKPVWDTCGSCELCLGDKETYCPFAQWTGLSKVGRSVRQHTGASKLALADQKAC